MTQSRLRWQEAGNGGDGIAEVVDVGQPEVADSHVESRAGWPPMGGGIGVNVADAA
jgi:hypothetical protein